MLFCVYYDFSGDFWSRLGCYFIVEFLFMYIICTCNYLIFFGGSMLVLLDVISFLDFVVSLNFFIYFSMYMFYIKIDI